MTSVEKVSLKKEFIPFFYYLLLPSAKSKLIFLFLFEFENSNN